MQIRRHPEAGKQFDPKIVEAFLNIDIISDYKSI